MTDANHLCKRPSLNNEPNILGESDSNYLVHIIFNDTIKTMMWERVNKSDHNYYEFIGNHEGFSTFSGAICSTC
jgi:hypothetical protein